MPATPSRLDGDGGVVTRLGAQRFQLLAGAFAEEDVPFAQRPAATDIQILWATGASYRIETTGGSNCSRPGLCRPPLFNRLNGPPASYIER